MMDYRLLVALVIFAVPAPALGRPGGRLAVLPVRKDATVPRSVSGVLDEIILTAAQARRTYRIVGLSDINAMLSLEKQKDMLGCGEETACYSALGNLLDVDKLMVVRLGRTAKEWVASAKLIDVRSKEVEARVVEFFGGEADAMLKSLPSVVTRLLGGIQPSEIVFGEGNAVSPPTIVIGDVGGPSLGHVNLAAEQAWEKALDLEEDPAATPGQRAEVWCRLEQVAAGTQYLAKATEGCHAWKTYDESLTRLRKTLVNDYRTLAGYLQLRRKTSTQKDAAVAAFLATYGSMPDDAIVAAVKRVERLRRNGADVVLPADGDTDGIPDNEDKCPTKSGTAATAGCPASDRDGDGIVDALDRCELVAEDRDGFRDADGCPDYDNDNDGVPDVRDRCPMQPGDRARALTRSDGCPAAD